MTDYLLRIHNDVMAEWQRRAKKSGEVIHFNYTTTAVTKQPVEVYIWDVDKTYLDTKFETFRGLVRTATERAHQKKNIPGSAKLVQAIRGSWIHRFKSELFPIFFITASPPQMERKIHEKLTIDGVNPFGIFCKDNLKNLRPNKIWRLNKQVGYKLQALLQLRSLLHPDVRMILFGDDGESDSIIYSLFSDICARRMDTSELRQVLNFFYVLDEQVDQIFYLQENIPHQDPVEKVYINLVDDTDAEYYLKFGRRTLPTANSLQVAVDLFQDQRLQIQHILDVAENLKKEFQFATEDFEKSLDDLVRRQRLGETACVELMAAFKTARLVSSQFHTSIKPRAVAETANGAIRKLEGQHEPWVPEHIDYRNEYR